MRARLYRCSVLLSVFLALPGRVQASIPRTLGFQGVLANPAGVPKANGNYTVTFRLYDALTVGNLLWTEASVPVTVAGGKGLFSTQLGAPTAFGVLAFDKPYWMEVQIQGEAPMTPRLALLSAPYALNIPSAALSLPFSGSANTASPAAALDVTNIGSGLGIQGSTNSTVFEASGLQGVATSTGQVAGVYGRATAGALGTGVAGKGSAVGGFFESYISTGVGAYGYAPQYGLYGSSLNGGSGVYGTSGYVGIDGHATASGGYGVVGQNADGAFGFLAGPAGNGIAVGVYGSASTAGVYGDSFAGNGVYGAAEQSGFGVQGYSVNSDGGHFTTTSGFSGVYGNGPHNGVYGQTASATDSGVWGQNTGNGNGVSGTSTGSGLGVYGSAGAGGTGGYFTASAGGLALYANGECRVKVLNIIGGADVAEKFNVDEKADPGTVVAIDPDHSGSLCVARGAYNRKVAGVLSGAGNLDAGLTLSAPGASGSQAVAMTGRVWVRCNTSDGPIELGDLLTTSDTAGYAMKVGDYARAQGATIGKAMTALPSGKGLVLALVTLQ